MKNPYQTIKCRRVTEKSRVLEMLKDATSNRSVSRCKSPKFVFEVDPKATKPEIAKAVEEIYKDQKVKVVKVNTINVVSKERRMKGFIGRTSAFKKAVVTLRPEDKLEETVG